MSDGASLAPAPRDSTVVRAVVVDADDRTRGSLVGLLAARAGVRVVGDAGHVATAIRLVEAVRPDIVLVDPRLPDVADGFALIRGIRGLDATIRILALCWSPELEHDTLAAGADAFVRKTFRPLELADAVARCMAVPGPPVPDPGLGRPSVAPSPPPALRPAAPAIPAVVPGPPPIV